MGVPSLLAFCRVVLGLVFALSLGGKCRDVQSFRQSIIDFHVIPPWLSGSLALLCLGGEGAVLLGMIVGQTLLLPAFALAALLLLCFSGAIASVLVRNLRTACHCFGKSDKPVSVEDLWRNGGFLCCALGGCIFCFWSPQGQGHLTLAAWFLVGATATVFVALGLFLGDLVALFKSP